MAPLSKNIGYNFSAVLFVAGYIVRQSDFLGESFIFPIFLFFISADAFLLSAGISFNRTFSCCCCCCFWWLLSFLSHRCRWLCRLLAFFHTIHLFMCILFIHSLTHSKVQKVCCCCFSCHCR